MILDNIFKKCNIDNEDIDILVWNTGLVMRKYADENKDFIMYGTGKPLRQFLYSLDFAKIIILLINKGLSKAVKYTGLGGLDKIFGFFFGFVRSYIIAVCVFTTIDIVYNYERWSINVDKSITFVFVEKGSNYLINEFPTQKEQEDAKEKIKDI